MLNRLVIKWDPEEIRYLWNDLSSDYCRPLDPYDPEDVDWFIDLSNHLEEWINGTRSAPGVSVKILLFWWGWEFVMEIDK